MSKIQLLSAASALGILSLVPTAEAFSVVNLDARAHILLIVEGDEEREVTLEPNEKASDLCSSTCEVNIDDGPDLYEAAANEALAIENGELMTADEQTEALTEDPAGEPVERPTEAPTE